jgi:hypothetical protein
MQEQEITKDPYYISSSVCGFHLENAQNADMAYLNDTNIHDEPGHVKTFFFNTNNTKQ